MHLIAALFRRAPREIVILAVLGCISGGSSAVLLSVVQKALSADAILGWMLLLFVATIAARVISSVVSMLFLVQFAQNTVLKLSRDLVTQVLRAPYAQIERVGPNQILAVMTDDVATLSAAILAIPGLTVNAAVLAGCALYLGWLSPVAFGALVIIGIAGGLFYRVLLRRAHVSIRLAREGRDRLFGVFRSVTDGIKELQLHRGRREAFVRDEVDDVTDFLKVQNSLAMRHFAIADAWTQVIFYLVLTTVLFGLAAREVPRETITAYVFAAIYCMNPVWAIIATLPVFERGQAAWERVQKLGASLSGPETPAAPPTFTHAATIAFENVTFTYPSPGTEHGFTLGPIDLTLTPGELVFVVGGNGSGKSTFVKLLTGLYQPVGGRITVNGGAVDAQHLDEYRELFSAVFSDFYLFDRLHGFSAEELRHDVAQYLRELDLDKKITIDGNRLSTIALSTGQRRRLALLTAYLENRQVYVLDEWAADQDPHYRAVFYNELLPELQRRGKTVIVITHDDRYFNRADRVLKLDFGRIVPFDPPAEGTHPAAEQGFRLSSTIR